MASRPTDGPAPRVRSPCSAPGSSSIPTVKATVHPAQLGLGTHHQLPAPSPCPSTREVAGGHDQHLREGPGADTHRQQASPAWPCLPPAPHCPAWPWEGHSSWQNPSTEPILTCLRGMQVPQGLFPVSSRQSHQQHPREGAAQGSPCNGNFATSWDVSPRAEGACGSPGCPAGQGHSAARARQVLSPGEAPCSSTCSAAGRGTAVPMAGKGGTNVTHWYPAVRAHSSALLPPWDTCIPGATPSHRRVPAEPPAPSPVAPTPAKRAEGQPGANGGAAAPTCRGARPPRRPPRPPCRPYLGGGGSPGWPRRRPGRCRHPGRA